MKLEQLAKGDLKRQPKFGLPKQVWQPQERGPDQKRWYFGQPKKGPAYRQSKGVFTGKAEAYDEHIL